MIKILVNCQKHKFANLIILVQAVPGSFLTGIYQLHLDVSGDIANQGRDWHPMTSYKYMYNVCGSKIFIKFNHIWVIDLILSFPAV